MLLSGEARAVDSRRIGPAGRLGRQSLQLNEGLWNSGEEHVYMGGL